jgi:catechol 2,3-dioxygenase-like lactoylglutathione lyase family enzyme
MATRRTHVTITISNIERSIGFYTSFCGLSVLRDRRLEEGGTVWMGPDTPPGKNPPILTSRSNEGGEKRILLPWSSG